MIGEIMESVFKINNTHKKSPELTYDDLVYLYECFKSEYGVLPKTSDCLSKNNLPQQRIVMKILDNAGITYNDFMNNLWKTSHIRANSKNYNFYIERYKELSDKKGSHITSTELKNNKYGLPSAQWFVKECPDKSVNSFDDFIRWCGYSSRRLDKEFISEKLICLENNLGRPIKRTDITTKSVGFSPIVINRIWGTLTNCKNELGLRHSSHDTSKPFSYYKEELVNILNRIRLNGNCRNYITWRDIENINNNPKNIEHKTFTKSFKKEGVDIFAFIKSYGFNMNPSNFSFHYTFADGERVVSSFEYDMSYFLKNEFSLRYNMDYFRDVIYKKFTSHSSTKMNCDYMFEINGLSYYLEIAGIISNSDGDWENHNYSSKQEQEYQQKLLLKKQIFESNGLKYLFLFSNDFADDSYKEKVKTFIK